MLHRGVFQRNPSAPQRELAAQADIDPVELYNVRQAIRPEHEQEVRKRYAEIHGKEPYGNAIFNVQSDAERLLYEREEERKIRWIIDERERMQRENEGKGKIRVKDAR